MSYFLALFGGLPGEPLPEEAAAGAKESGKGFPETPDLTIYTDGSALGNPGPAGWAYVRSDGEEDSGPLGWAGNNVAELTAVARALQSCPPGSQVQIVTDSRNVIGWLDQGWKRQNPRIQRTVEGILKTIQTRKLRVTYRKIPGHSNQRENERAHALAEAAARQHPSPSGC